MSRNKNHRVQMSFDNPEVEGEFLEDSADSMLSVSDSLGNMDSSDTIMMTEIDRSILDDYSVNPVLDEAEGRERGRKSRMKASHHPERARAKAVPRRRVASKTALPELRAVFKPLKEKVQGLLQPYNKDLNQHLSTLGSELKVRSSQLDKRIKTTPYLFVLGAMVAGFALSHISSPRTMRGSY
ncbi:MAG: hypothetical protein EOP10_30350 [Proteobacteria bacterium]|nr:MAG: hypothetical protein EOP10_30350 [Pseudomonadota bacterium]